MATVERTDDWSGMFRAFTVLCAMVLFSAQTAMERYTVGSESWQVLYAYEGLTTWSIPALFMLCGMSGLRVDKKVPISYGLRNLLLPTIVQLFVWGTLFAVLPTLLEGGILSVQTMVRSFQSAVQGGTHGHLWILYPLIALYLFHPLFQRFIALARREELHYILGVSFFFSSVLPMLEVFYPNHVIVIGLTRLQFPVFLNWVCCYVLGWYLQRYMISRVSEVFCYLCGILGMFLTQMGESMMGGGQALWHHYTSPNSLVTAVGMCVLFRYVLGFHQEESGTGISLGESAFGVYLIHPLWIQLLGHFQIWVWSFLPIFSVPLFALLSFILSLPVVWLIQRIPLLEDYLV